MSKKITVYSLMLSKSLRKTFLQTTLLRHLAYLRELLVLSLVMPVRKRQLSKTRFDGKILLA